VDELLFFAYEILIEEERKSMTLSVRYSALFSETDQEVILQRIREIGYRLKNPEYVFKMGAIAKMQSRYREVVGSLYTPQSLVRGVPGLALMYGEIDRVLPGENWDQIAHQYLSHLQSEISLEEFQSPGLFSGICGFFFALHHLSRGGARYQKALSQTKEVVSLLVNKYASLLTLNNNLQPEHYALPDGAVGIVATLLTLAEEVSQSGDEAVFPELSLLVEHLTWLGRRDIARDVQQFDHWYTPSASAIRESQMRWRADGSAYSGYGIQHGLAGLVAILSLTMTSHVNVTLDNDISEAIQVLSQQIRKGICKDEEGWHWPQQSNHGNDHSSNGSLSYSWCTGTCGIAHALWLAGQALEDNDLRTLALECISSVYRRFFQHPEMIGPSLCHGIAGMLQVCAHFVNDTGDPMFVEHLRALTEYILGLFEKDRPFGYRAFEPEFVRVDTPWLLEGAAGVALALSTLVNPLHVSWDRLLLLS
jgi:lantibiotic biosynthesis protein